MIIIFSQSGTEGTTEAVMDWLLFYGQKFRRINAEDFYNSFSYELDKIKFCGVDIDKISAIWFRRWYPPGFISNMLIKQGGILGQNLISMNSQIVREYSILRNHVFSQLKEKKWLTSFNELRYSKLDVLRAASDCGLEIPKTLITSEKKTLLDFLKENKRIIVKPIGEVIFLTDEDDDFMYSYKMLTKEIDLNYVQQLPETIPFVSLFQSLIEKKYEIRAFFIGDKFYSMAIFSQGDSQTELDFRNYNDDHPNRTVPYLLPKYIETKLLKLKRMLNFTTGSIDLIKDKHGNYFFLEVNPVGQLGMVSYPCNYYLERKVAEHLIS